MQSLTYKDIIDDKIAEWQSDLNKLQEHAEKASSEAQSRLKEKVKQMGAALDTAIVQLHDLNAQETAGNTMETKDKILKIFNSIDKEFTGYEAKTPFML